MRRTLRLVCAAVAGLLTVPGTANASVFEGETLDQVANVVSWIVLVVVPVICLVVFWLVHILPEKIAERNNHPQAKAIQVLCLLSLGFGGILWPLAWLWTYTKPVLHRLAYGTDVGDHEPAETSGATHDEPSEVERLQERIAELEARLVAASSEPEAR